MQEHIRFCVLACAVHPRQRGRGAASQAAAHLGRQGRGRGLRLLQHLHLIHPEQPAHRALPPDDKLPGRLAAHLRGGADNVRQDPVHQNELLRD
uniref:GNAT family N-acetyltransferase n=1 Tax=Pontibacter russatus TaxID=2694929 RepID=UPI00374309F3